MSLNVCETHNGFIVVYEGKTYSHPCPVCDKEDELRALGKQVESLEEQVDSLKDDLANAQK